MKQTIKLFFIFILFPVIAQAQNSATASATATIIDENVYLKKANYNPQNLTQERKNYIVDSVLLCEEKTRIKNRIKEIAKKNKQFNN